MRGHALMHLLFPFNASLGQSAKFILLLPVRPFSGLVGETAYSTISILLFPARLASAHWWGYFFNKVHCPTYWPFGKLLRLHSILGDSNLTSCAQRF